MLLTKSLSDVSVFKHLMFNMRYISTSSTLFKERLRTKILAIPKADEGNKGEKSVEIDITGYQNVVEFPQLGTPEQLFNNIPFKHLPIVNIKASKNNTLFNLTNHEGVPIYSRSCGVDGFKNCRKRTNIAAQVTGQSFGNIISKMGYNTCRVNINGLGAGRASSFKGLQMAGINIVSITDNTPIFDYPKKRPPAARSV